MTEQDRLEFWTKALNLPGFQVVHERHDTPADPLTLTVVPALPLGLCSAMPPRHRLHPSHPGFAAGQGPVRGPQAVELIVRTYQFHRCCDRYFTSLSRPGGGAHATERFLEQAAKLIRFSDIANAKLSMYLRRISNAGTMITSNAPPRSRQPPSS